MRSPPSTKASALATGGIAIKASTMGIEKWFERGQSPLSYFVWENKLSYSSASNMMAVKHNTNSANTKNSVKAAAPAPLAVVAVFMTSLKLLGTLHLEDS